MISPEHTLSIPLLSPERTRAEESVVISETVGWAGLPPFTRGAWRVLAVVTMLFVVAVSLRLNGSSSGFWHAGSSADIRVRDVQSGILLGTPKFVRGDEWYVWTPAILSQARQPKPFPVSNPSLGPGATPLLMGLPARHYTMVFRPQLWGYFFLPFDRAFAWNWNAKVCGLFAGLFTLFWALTGGRLGPAVFGAVAVQFSGYVQWWFSTPASLPEMLACWSVAVVAALALFQAGSWRRKAGWAAALVWSFANFLLCCYPGFEVPLLYLGVCVVGGFVWQHRAFSKGGMAWVAGALVVAVLLLVPWMMDCLPALRVEAGTIYPGQRRVYGGGLLLGSYLSGLFTLGMSDEIFPHPLGNPSEASNFYPLWLLPLGMGAWAFARFVARRERAVGPWLRERGLKVLLAGYLVALTTFCFVPLPHGFVDLTGLSRCMECRVLVGVGMAGTVLFVLCLASRPAGAGRVTRAAVWAGLVWTAGVVGFLMWFRGVDDGFLTPWNMVGFAATAAFFAGTYLCGPRWVLPTVWAGVFCFKLALVNPVCVGLPELLESPMMNHLRAIVRSDPYAGWAVYHSIQGAELIKTSGAHVINGARIIPDFSVIDRLDPAHRDREVYNRYGHLYFGETGYQETVPVSLLKMVHCVAGIGPRRLRELFPEVRYVASARPIPGMAEEGFRLIGSIPDNNLWVYQLGGNPGKGEPR